MLLFLEQELVKDLDDKAQQNIVTQLTQVFEGAAAALVPQPGVSSDADADAAISHIEELCGDASAAITEMSIDAFDDLTTEDDLKLRKEGVQRLLKWRGPGEGIHCTLGQSQSWTPQLGLQGCQDD